LTGEHAEGDLELLRRYEPVLHFNRGEHFFPAPVEPYVCSASLWVQTPGGETTCLVPAGSLNLKRLGQRRPVDYDSEPGSVYFLQYANPLDVVDLVTYKQRARSADRVQGNLFRAGWGRLARVGYLSRFIDALFTLSLLARGRVSGDTAAAARIHYEAIQEQQERYQYYGRVVRQDGWVVLQYWLFYFFNDWRSSFYGVNDHEADWELVTVYLAEDPSEPGSGHLHPEWLAYASHDYFGDDLRRRWDDPKVEKVGDHPVVYVGAGSHASYYEAGEYITEFPLPFLAPVVRLLDRIQRAQWYRRVYGYVHDGERAQEASSIFKVPFIDYARGDGLSLGQGQGKGWGPPVLFDETPDWVLNFRGLWGLYTRDPFAGEDAPAGPMYNRDGTVRRAWHDPLGWAGLDKVPPPSMMLDVIRTRQQEVQLRRDALLDEQERKGHRLKGLAAEAAAIRRQPDLRAVYSEYAAELETLAGELAELKQEIAQKELVLRSLARHEQRLKGGQMDSPTVHIRRARRPVPPDVIRQSRFVEVWAALSVGVFLFGFALLFLFARQYTLTGLLVIFYVVVLIEAWFRQQIGSLLTRTALLLALIASLTLLFTYSIEILGTIVLLAGGYILIDNLREMWT
jgi:hypothetical protein